MRQFELIMFSKLEQQKTEDTYGRVKGSSVLCIGCGTEYLDGPETEEILEP